MICKVCIANITVDNSSLFLASFRYLLEKNCVSILKRAMSIPYIRVSSFPIKIRPFFLFFDVFWFNHLFRATKKRSFFGQKKGKNPFILTRSNQKMAIFYLECLHLMVCTRSELQKCTLNSENNIINYNWHFSVFT